jgi:zinc/manganese transport system substrate-binding protein
MTVNRGIRALTYLLGVVLTMGSQVSPASETGTSRPLTVVASFTILADLVSQVGGGRVKVTSMVGPGGDAHTFSPSPADSVSLARADLVIANGLGFDTWMNKLVEVSGTTAPLIVATKKIKPIFIDGDHDHAHSHGHGHGKDGERVPDPHHWHDPENLIVVVRTLQEELARIDPDHQAYYEERAAGYMGRLRELDGWIKARLDTIPPANRKIVTSHDSIAYLARRYDLEVTITAMGSLTTESADPSAAQVAKVVRAIRKQKVPAVFFDTTHSSALMARIAEEAKVKLAPPLYTDALGNVSSGITDTIAMMRHNADIITTSLGGKL